MEEDKKPEGKRYRTMESIAGVFTESDVRQKLFGNKGFQFYLFQKRWKKIVGSLMAEESYISGCKGPLLFVRVTNSAFLQQLFMMKADILKELSKDEIGRYFTDIKFLAGSPQKPYKPFTTLDPVNSAIEKEQKRYSQSLSEGEEAWIQNWVRSHVKKEAVRAPFAEMMEEVLKIRKGELADGYHPCSICGNLCPRGGFLERIISKYSPNKPMPDWANSTKVRIGVLLFLLCMVGINGSRDPGSWQHWGFVFWLVCFVTTAFGAIIAFFWNARSWCAICPMGTIQSWLGGNKYHLEIDQKTCKSCKKCERSCPMHLSIIKEKTENTLPNTLFSKDCIRCGECEEACPVKTLHFEKGALRENEMT